MKKTKAKKITTGKKKSKKWIGIVVALFVVFGLFGGDEEAATEDTTQEIAIVEEVAEAEIIEDEIVEEETEAVEEETIVEEEAEVISNLMDDTEEVVADIDKSTPEPTPEPEPPQPEPEPIVVVTEPAPAPAPEPQSTPAGMVWLSATGSKYHSINNCGKMNPSKARQVTESEALAQNMEKCDKCW